MEIIHVVLGKANPERMNGVNRMVHNLATHQVAAGLNVSVCGITKDAKHNYPDRPFVTNLFKFGSHMLSLDHWLKEFILSKQETAVFHIHGGFILKWFALARWMKKNKVKYVFTPHGSYNLVAMERSSLRKKLYIALFERFVLRNAMSIHCLGLSEVNGLRSIYSGSNVLLIPTGIDLNPQGESSRSKEFVISFCGRLDVHTKGLDLLIEGFAKFQSEINEAKLEIIGDGNGMEALKGLCNEYKLADAVTLHGACFGEHKDRLISGAHIFAHPSRNEGLPTAVLEAAAMGMPCLISEATNVADYIRKYNAGVVLADMTSDAVYDALVNAYRKFRHHELEKMGMNALKMVKTEFNWNKVVSDFGKLYLAA
jgi:glycosyltransferase involved in cell wall biosynthesis